MSISDTVGFDHIPGEEHLISCLQKNLHFSVNNKTIKRGRLLLFRKFHYFIQIALLTERGVRENFEIPIPFGVESYSDDGLIYFDYRTKALQVDNLPKIPEKVNSIYFDKILEIQIITNASLVCI
jgi:hypothetical protein